MCSGAFRTTAALALLICLLCPLLETFDTWDHTLQTGNDTEYGLVVLALCVGVAYSLVRFILKAVPVGFVASNRFRSCKRSVLVFTLGFRSCPFESVGSPPLPLRI